MIGIEQLLFFREQAKFRALSEGLPTGGEFGFGMTEEEGRRGEGKGEGEEDIDEGREGLEEKQAPQEME